MTAKIRKIEREVDPGLVQMIEEILADAKAGKIKDVVIVGDHVEDGELFRAAFFESRWRLLGALEYAKDAVQRG